MAFEIRASAETNRLNKGMGAYQRNSAHINSFDQEEVYGNLTTSSHVWFVPLNAARCFRVGLGTI